MATDWHTDAKRDALTVRGNVRLERGIVPKSLSRDCAGLRLSSETRVGASRPAVLALALRQGLPDRGPMGLRDFCSNSGLVQTAVTLFDALRN